MKILNIAVNHHEVLGSTNINLFGDSSVIRPQQFEPNFSDLLIEADSNDYANYYTFIIGQNGIGKTILFKTIVNYINNSNEAGRNRTLGRIIKLYSKNDKYKKFKFSDPGHQDLIDLGIYNQNYYIKELGRRVDFLEHFDAQLIYISSAFEKSIVHKNDRFRSFNYLSEINQTKLLFLLCLIRFHGTDKINRLNNILERENVNWKLECGLAYQASGGIDSTTNTILLRDNEGLNIVSFLALLEKIEIGDDNVLVSDKLTKPEIRIWNIIYNSGAFFKLLHNSNLEAKQLFKLLKRSRVLKRLRLFLASEVDSTTIEESLNVRQAKNGDWNFLKISPDQLTELDALFLGLLENLRLVDISVTANGVSVEKMSSGEQSLIRIFSFFADLPLQDRKENLIVFFDEPENTLHPKWQQNFPASFKRIIEDVYEISASHFIFATHSPLILMKSAQISGTNVLRFYRDTKKNFRSEQIENVNSFSIEEVLLDEFRISYRDRELENSVAKMLDEQNKKSIGGDDPIDSVSKSFELRKKIDDLYNSLNSQS